MATLEDLNNTLKEQNQLLVGNRVKEIENQREQSIKNDQLLSAIQQIAKGVSSSSAAFKQGDRQSGGLIAGLLGGLGGGIGSIGESVGKLGVGFGKGMAALGAGIAGFMLALGGADVILGLIGANGESLKTVVQNFFGAFSEETALMMGGLITLAGIASKLKVGAAELATSMTAMGAGISGFFGGLILGDIVGTLATGAGLDGSNLATLIKNFTSALAAGGTEGFTLIGSILALGTLAGIANADPMTILTSMTAMGAGLAGFFGGILLADGISKIAADGAGLDGSSLGNLVKNFVGAFKDTGATGVGVLATILGVGAITGIVGAATNGAGAISMAGGIIAGMTAMGAGIAGFFGGILLADGVTKLVTDASGIDGSSLATLIKNFVGAFKDSGATGVSLLASIMGVGAITGIVGVATGGAGALALAGGIIAGMTALGAGLVGFFGGVLAGDGLSVLAKSGGIDGSSLAALITNFTGAFKTKESIVLLAGLLAAATASSVLPGGGVGIAAGMTAIGAGLVGFFSAFIVGDFLTKILSVDTKKVGDFMGDIGEGIGKFIGGLATGAIRKLNEIDSDKLGKLGSGINQLGTGILAFAAGQGVGVITGAIESIAGFFGADSPIDKIAEISKREDIDTTRLKSLGDGIYGLGMGLKAFGDIDNENFNKSLDSLMKLGDIPSNIAFNLSPATTAIGGVENQLEGVRPYKTGGLVTETGLAVLHGTPSQPELVLDNQAAQVFMKAAQLLTGSQNMQMSSSLPPVVVNNIDNSQRNPVISNQATQIKVPDNPRQGETTLAMMNMAYSMG